MSQSFAPTANPDYTTTIPFARKSSPHCLDLSHSLLSDDLSFVEVFTLGLRVLGIGGTIKLVAPQTDGRIMVDGLKRDGRKHQIR